MSDSAPKVASAISEAQSIIEAAEQRAKALEEKAKQSFDQAFDKGYEAGFERGRQEAAESAIRLLEENGKLSDQLAAEAARLAIAITSSVVGGEVASNPSVVRQNALRALRESVVGNAATIYVHPEDRAVLDPAIEQLERVAGGAKVVLDIDPSLTRGGCIVRTDFGEVDARIETLIGLVAVRLGVPHYEGSR